MTSFQGTDNKNVIIVFMYTCKSTFSVFLQFYSIALLIEHTAALAHTQLFADQLCDHV